MKIAFCIENFDPSGGLAHILNYANSLVDMGNSVTIVTRHLVDDGKNTKIVNLDERISVKPLDQVSEITEEFDIAIATFWKTIDFIFEINSLQYALFIQSLESRFYRGTDADISLMAGVIQGIDIPVITIADWIANALATADKESKVYLVKNGVDKSIFASNLSLENKDFDGPLRLVIEGSSAWFKGVDNVVSALENIDFPVDVEWFSVDGSFRPSLISRLNSNPHLRIKFSPKSTQQQFKNSLRNSHLLLKLSTVEGLPGPPLEAFHSGCTGIFTNVTGIEEYAVHGKNCLIVPFDDSNAVSNWLEILDKNRSLLKRLSIGALETANNWPDLKTSANSFSNAVSQIVSNRKADDLKKQGISEFVKKAFQMISNESNKLITLDATMHSIALDSSARDYIISRGLNEI